MNKPTQEQIEEWVNAAGVIADDKTQSPGEFQPSWHTWHKEYDVALATLAYTAGMESAAKQLRAYAAEHFGAEKSWAETFADILEASNAV